MQEQDPYFAALDRAGIVAGAGDAGWNDRFRAALDDEGLALSPHLAASARYPDGAAAAAPLSFTAPNGWPADTFLVWADDASPVA